MSTEHIDFTAGERERPWTWYARLLVGPERVVREHLRHVEAARIVPRVPNEWQLAQGVLRMWHRLIFRTETVGTCATEPVRPTLRARLWSNRALRLPVLLAQKVIAPFDSTGLASSPARIVRHLLGAHHDGAQFVYDLQLLGCYPDGLAMARRAVDALLQEQSPRTEFLRDLTVFENYHEQLRDALARAERGELGLSDAQEFDPDISFTGYLRWCANQPETPSKTLYHWRRGEYTIADGVQWC